MKYVLVLVLWVLDLVLVVYGDLENEWGRKARSEGGNNELFVFERDLH